MYAYFIGEIAKINEDSVILETNHIGYHIYMTTSDLNNLTKNKDEVKIYTYTCVREDAFILYGFLTEDSLALFKLLLTVSGIGPKGALSILSVMDTDTLRMSILSQDAKLLSKAPGIGVKTAGRIILELKDKVHPEDLLRGDIQNTEDNSSDNSVTVRAEAGEALMTLGYSNADVYRVLRQILITDQTTVEMVIKEALKKMI